AYRFHLSANTQESLSDRIIRLPMSTNMTLADCDRIISLVLEFLSSRHNVEKMFYQPYQKPTVIKELHSQVKTGVQAG
ncbi:MAG: hypothetical protein LH647_18445, partial [Leptolyngbyaceae cyanobacterium CAN_BIN12]|nr:hypothetical protein [Leptolyngbyaceae cyanobacterium CAN_BIN12]